MIPTLVIVEDVKPTRDKLVQLLKETFDIVATAENGRQAIDVVGRLKPKLVTMDIAMPLLSGLEATKIIMERFSPKPKIVILSGMKDPSVVTRAFEAGAVEYLFKPFKGQKLINTLLSVSQMDVELKLCS